MVLRRSWWIMVFLLKERVKSCRQLKRWLDFGWTLSDYCPPGGLSITQPNACVGEIWPMRTMTGGLTIDYCYIATSIFEFWKTNFPQPCRFTFGCITWVMSQGAPKIAVATLGKLLHSNWKCWFLVELAMKNGEVPKLCEFTGGYILQYCFHQNLSMVVFVCSKWCYKFNDHVEVSWNGVTQKWMVYNGQSC